MRLLRSCAPVPSPGKWGGLGKDLATYSVKIRQENSMERLSNESDMVPYGRTSRPESTKPATGDEQGPAASNHGTYDALGANLTGT